MGDRTVPRTIEQIDPGWLSTALRSDPATADVTVSAVAVEPIGVGIGVMALLYRLTPTYEGAAGPATLVAKLGSLHEQTRQIARGYRFYEREVAVYRDLGDRLGLNPPHAYVAEHDPETDDFVILMDDLSGRRVVSQLDGCSPDDAMVVVRALGAHHAEWWMSGELAGLGYIQSPGEPPYPQFHAQSTKEAWSICRSAFSDSVPHELHDIAERWADIGPALMEENDAHPYTFTHGDVRLDNVFFHDDAAGTISLVDWQIGFRNGGAFDVAYFLGQSMTVSERRETEDELLHAYHEALVAGGVTDYPWDELVADYGRSLLFAFCYPLSAGASCDLVNERAVELVSSMFQRVSMAIVDHDALRYLPA